MALREDDKTNFEALLSGHHDVCLVESELNGESVAVLCIVNWSDGEEVIMTPLAMMLTDKMIEQLPDPYELMERTGE